MIATFITVTALAQTELGFHAGPAWVNFQSKNATTDSRTSWASGFSAAYFLNKHFSLVANVLYGNKGKQMSITYYDQFGNTLGSYIEQQKLDYITLPMMLRVGLGTDVMVFANAGIYAAYLLNARINEQMRNGSNNYRFNKQDLGIVGGAGFYYPFNEYIKFSGEVRLHQGLLNIYRAAPFTNNWSGLFLVGVHYRL